MRPNVSVILTAVLSSLVVLLSARLAGQSAQPNLPNLNHSWAKLSGEAREIRFESLTRADAIPADRIFQVLQDRRGFTWFTTVAGLVRWDGYQSVGYSGLPMVRDVLRGDTIPGVLYEARNGILWVASNVITPFDPSTGTFGSPLNPLPRAAQPLSDAVTAFLEASDGSLRLGVSSYRSEGDIRVEASEPVLYHLNPITRASTAHHIDPNITLGRPAGIRAIEQDRRGRLWLGTSIGLICFDPSSGSFRHFPHEHPGTSTIWAAHFNALVWDRTGHLWVHLPTGIERFDPESGVFDRFVQAPFRYLRADPAGRFWLSFGSPPAMVFDPYAPAETALRSISYRSPDALAEPNTFYMMNPDRQGNVWAYLAPAGTVRYSPATARFGKYLPEWKYPNSLSGRAVRGFAENADGSIWIATAHNGLSRSALGQLHANSPRPQTAGRSGRRVGAICLCGQAPHRLGLDGKGYSRNLRASKRPLPAISRGVPEPAHGAPTYSGNDCFDVRGQQGAIVGQFGVRKNRRH